MTELNASSSHRAKLRLRHCEPLAEPLLRSLNAYRLAAGAAGVAMLACSAPSNGAPICGSLSVTLPRTETYAFNPAHQKVAPFNVAHTFNDLSSHPQSYQVRGFFTPNTPDAKVMLSTNGLPADIPSGASVGPGGKFGKGKSYGLVFGDYYLNRYIGNFQPNQSGYIGFQFSETGQVHYGWLRVRLANLNGWHSPSLELSEFGYESAPNTAILAGNCAGSASIIEPASKPQMRAAISAEKKTSEDAAPLGLLALGSQGLPQWREEMLLNIFARYVSTSKSFTGDQPCALLV